MSKNKSVKLMFLEKLKEDGDSLTIFLTNGIKLQGKITWCDDLSLMLYRDGITQLVYQHAISTVMPSPDFNLSGVLSVQEVESVGNR